MHDRLSGDIGVEADRLEGVRWFSVKFFLFFGSFFFAGVEMDGIAGVVGVGCGDGGGGVV